MGNFGAVLRHPDEVLPLFKFKMAVRHAEEQIPPEPHWAFCYTILHKISPGWSLIISELHPQIRKPVCVFYLVLRALDTIEDDTSIAIDVKVPILEAFHRHVYNCGCHFSCGTKDCKVLMDQFHHVSTAFLELRKDYQEIIEDVTNRMGEGMAKFICKEVETINDYDEYCHYAAGVLGIGLPKIFHATGFEDLPPENLCSSFGFFLQKTNVVQDYLEDINEIPKSRIFWPREIWSKYVYSIEELKYEENSVKAVQCLNEMVTYALIHVEDFLHCLSTLRDPGTCRSCAIPQIIAMGTLALCYNNVEVFRRKVKMRPGLVAKIFDRTRTMADVYGVFFDFSCILKAKIDQNDPNAAETLERVEAIQKACWDSGPLNKRKSYIFQEEHSYTPLLLQARDWSIGSSNKWNSTTLLNNSDLRKPRMPANWWRNHPRSSHNVALSSASNSRRMSLKLGYFNQSRALIPCVISRTRSLNQFSRIPSSQSITMQKYVNPPMPY